MRDGEESAQPMSARFSDNLFSTLPLLPLLTAEEEVELAKQIEAGVYARQLLGTDCCRHADLQKLSDTADSAMEQMIRANLGLVPFVAKTYLGQGLDFEELVNEGIVGLVLAVQKFDYKRGFKFSTVAVWWIRYALTVGTANTGRTIRVPRSVHADIVKLRRAESRLMTTHLAVPDCEIASYTGLAEKRVRELRELAKPIFSLDATLSHESDLALADVCADLRSPSTLDRVLAGEITSRLYDIFGILSDVEMQYLDLRYGLSNGRPRSKSWTREALDLDPEEVAIIQKRIDSLMQYARSQDVLSCSR